MDDSLIYNSPLFRRPRKGRKVLRLALAAALAVAGTALFFVCPLAVPAVFFAALRFLP